MNETFTLIFWLMAVSTALLVTYKMRSDPLIIFAIVNCKNKLHIFPNQIA